MILNKIPKIVAGSCILLAPLVHAEMDYLSSVSGKLTTQCSLDTATCESVVAAFNKAVTEKTGKAFKASMIRLSTSESNTRLSSELGSSQKAGKRKCKDMTGDTLEACLNKTYKTRIDVVFGGTDGPYRGALGDNLFAKYAYKTDGVHPWAAKLVKDSDGRLGAMYMGILGLAYNKDVLAAKGMTPPTGWADLAKPEFKGTIGVANANTSGTSYKYLSSMLSAFGSEAEGWNRIVANHKNIAQYTKSGSAPCKMVGRGELPVCIGFMHDIANMAYKGFPIVGVAPKEGTLFEVGPIAIVIGSKNRANAEAFAQFLYEPATQVALVAGGGRQFHSNVDSKIPEGAPDIAKVTLLDADPKLGTKAFKKSVIDKWNNDIYPIPR
jgi:iron(III) transport system substrate-binding protein